MMPMPHDAQHSDEPQDMDMIKQILQKIIDDMDKFESDRLMPESRKPKVAAVDVHAEGSPMEEASESPEEENQEDPQALDELMGKASEADDEGALPEDHEADLHPAIAAIVKAKKKQLPA